MKRLTAILVAGIFVLAPLSASAMEMMEDSSMKDVTGQAGVSIAIDDVVLESWVGETKYTDVDGATSDEVETSVVISDQHTVQDFQAITEDTSGSDDGSDLTSPGVGLDQTDSSEGVDRMRNEAADGTYDGSGTFQSYALTIDVGTCTALSEGMTYNDPAGTGGDYTVAGVVIGLPTLEINTSASTKDIGIEQSGAANDGDNYIRIEEGASTLHVLGGRVEIAPH